MSLPEFPIKESFPASPLKILFALFPVTVSSPPPAFTFSIESKVSLPSPVSWLLVKDKSIWFPESLNTAVSIPVPPDNKSSPVPPLRVSLPLSPKRKSLPPSPFKTSFPLCPRKESPIDKSPLILSLPVVAEK